MVGRVKGLALLVCALCVGCSEVELDLLAPGIDAGLPELDAGPPEASLDTSLPTESEASTPIDAGRSSLILRYDFAGTGSEVRASVGSASAFARGGAQLDGSGVLELDGVDDYVDLPNRSLASLESATVMTWVTWSGGVCWQRAFDFGNNDAGEGMQGNALASLFVTFSSCPGGTLLAMYEQSPMQRSAESRVSLAAERPLQLALAFDGANQTMRLYLDGERVAERSVGIPLSALNDVNAWLGRSQWTQDRFARARYDEFRLYDRALGDSEVRDAFTRGPSSP
jgi:hypothetical protein